jgi:hypothetical protein
VTLLLFKKIYLSTETECSIKNNQTHTAAAAPSSSRADRERGRILIQEDTAETDRAESGQDFVFACYQNATRRVINT